MLLNSQLRRGTQGGRQLPGAAVPPHLCRQQLAGVAQEAQAWQASQQLAPVGGGQVQLVAPAVEEWKTGAGSQ